LKLQRTLIKNSNEAIMNISKTVVVAVSVAFALAACKPAGPPPDIVKTQREALQKARNVGAVEQKSADEQQKAADEATK
jgi:hypothetical protein